MSYFYYESHKIFYETLGSGAPLLLLHGNTASSRMFAEVKAAYAQHFQVILMDFLGSGQSARTDTLPADLWYHQGLQAVALLRELGAQNVSVIGSSGGALSAINAALEAPELIARVIADSFEGERALPAVTAELAAGREASKHDRGAVEFYRAMHGADWERVVDCDTAAVLRHEREIGQFFHKPLSALSSEILLTGSRADEFLSTLGPGFFDAAYGALLQKIGHGEMRLFDHGGHPAMLTNFEAFFPLSLKFLRGGEA